MFCGECGTKNKKGDTFCSECGAKLVENIDDNSKNIVSPKSKKVEVSSNNNNNNTKVSKPLSKGILWLIISASALVIAIITFVIVCSNLTNPKNVANDYIQAVVNKDSNKLYKYVKVDGDNTFTSKEVFSLYVKDELKDLNITNYTITDVKYSFGRLQAKVTFKYTLKNSSSEKSKDIILTRQKGKKYLFFDNWTINDSLDSSVVKDYTLKVAKGSSLIFGGVKVDKKYLDNNKSNTQYDVYVLPQVFTYKTKIKAILPSGLEIEDSVKPSKYYNTHTVSYDEDSMSKTTKDKINKYSSNVINTIYNGIISDKSFSDIKSSFEFKGNDLKKLENSYTELYKDIKDNSNTLTSFKVTNVNIYDVDVTKDGYLEVELKVNYDYVVKYKSYSNEEKVNDDSDYRYMTLTLAYSNNNYYLIDIDDFATYFSNY